VKVAGPGLGGYGSGLWPVAARHPPPPRSAGRSGQADPHLGHRTSSSVPAIVGVRGT